ncbi:MAG: ABC transporter substrate-binding protein [Pseudomonadota bacterium]
MRWLYLLLIAFSGAAFACGSPAADASRIAIAGGSITEVVYFLGEESRIVAVDTTSNYPAQALELPSVGYVRSLSTEGLLSLNPSLILGEDDMGPPAVLAQIEQAGVETIRLSEVHTADGIVDKVRCIAQIIGAEQRADRLIETQLADAVDALSAFSQGSTSRPRVAVVLGLRDGVPLGAGRETSGHGLIDMASGENVFADFEGWKPISIEAMVAADPDFIIVPQRGVDEAGGPESLLSHPGLRLTTAAREGNLIAMDGMSMLGFGPRTLGTALELASELHRSPDNN